MQKVLFKSEITQYAQYFDANTVEYLSKQLTESFEGFSDFDLMAFQWYDVCTDETCVSQILIYIDRDSLFFFCDDERTVNKCNELLVEGQSNEKALYLFFVGLLSSDAKRLELFETNITDAEDSALQSSHSDYLRSIREYRKELLRLKRYYEELHTITDHLQANDNELFSKDGVRHFSIIHNRVSLFCSNVMSLRDYVTQMREACQSQIDIEQNNLMRIFTVITAIFLPLTLIVGWYGMNFINMPELTWRYGYIAVTALSAIVCVVMVIWFKHKKWI